jgi:hypothetical protein
MVRRSDTFDSAMIVRERFALNQLRVAVWVALVLFVPFYIYRHADMALRLVRGVDAILYVSIICNLLLAWMARAARDLAIYRNQGIRIGFVDLLVLNNRQFSLNYLPMKLGTLQFAASLKSRYGLAYSAYAGAFLVQNILVVFVASIFSIGAILLFADIDAAESRLLLVAFILIAAAVSWVSFTTLRLDFLPRSLASRLTSIHGEITRFASVPAAAAWSLMMSVAGFRRWRRRTGVVLGGVATVAAIRNYARRPRRARILHGRAGTVVWIFLGYRSLVVPVGAIDRPCAFIVFRRPVVSPAPVENTTRYK